MTIPIPTSPSLTQSAGAISMVENPHLVRLTAKDLVIETPMTYTHKRVVMSGSGACDPMWPRRASRVPKGRHSPIEVLIV